jgi:hypothetical protein
MLYFTLAGQLFSFPKQPGPWVGGCRLPECFNTGSFSNSLFYSPNTSDSQQYLIAFTWKKKKAFAQDSTCDLFQKKYAECATYN